MKISLLFVILFMFFNAFSQHESDMDSMKIEPVDTNYNHSIGFLLGGGVTFGNVTASNFSQADTFLNWGTKPQPLFNIGILYNHDFNDRWSLQTGAIFNLSKLVLTYTMNGINTNDTSNYSTIAVPILFSYKTNNNPNGLKFSAGVLTEIDISKRVDQNNRVFPLKTFSPAAYGAIGYQIKSYTSIIEIKLFGQINPMNILKNNNSTYTNALEKLYFWRTGIIFILR